MKKKVQGISLRYKFLILLTTLPLLALSTYLLLAIQVFEDDKIAYVFDASGSVSRTVSAQVRAELTAVINLTRPIANGYDFEKDQITPFAEQVFQNENTFGLMGFYRPNLQSGQLQLKTVLRKKSDPFAEATNKIAKYMKNPPPSLMAELNKAKNEGVRVLPSGVEGDDRLLVATRFGDFSTSQALIALTLINTENIVPVFAKSGSQSVFLVGGKGHIVMGPEAKGQSLGTVVDPKILDRIRNAKVPEGTAEVSNQKGEAVLMSYSPVGYGDLFTTAMVNKSSALQAVNILIEKSVLFFVALLSATVIISIFASGTLTSAISSLYLGTQKVAEGNFDISIDVKSNDEVGSLADSFIKMAAEVKRLMMETAEKARMEGELKTAQTVQETLFPERTAQLDNLMIAGNYQPASECGGDWWHYCRVGKKIFVWIGDATGHGAPAALITSAAKSAATIIERLNVTPGVALELLNRSIYDVSKGRLMMTFFLGAYDTETGELTYCNASHDPPLLFQKSDKPLKKRALIPLNDVNNPRLGQDRGTKFEDFTVKLEPGHSIFLYTDGIPELYNDQGEMWGEREFIKALIKSNEGYPDPQTAVERMTKAIDEFRHGAALSDDVTFFQIQLAES